MQAVDIMTREVVSVDPDLPTSEIARRLVAHSISAVPVVDSAGTAVGMVSEGDLIGRDDAGREARRDWWLDLLAEGEALSPQFLAALRAPPRTARDVMSAPLVTVSETAEVADIARLLATYNIKRVPVLRDGRIVGIVSRADLLRALSRQGDSSGAETKHGGLLAAAIASIDGHFHQHRREARTAAAPATATAPATNGFSAGDFRHLVADFIHEKDRRRQAERNAVLTRRRARLKELIDNHVGDAGWKALLDQARQAAERGQTRHLLLRFPSQLCSDGGRAINAPDPAWPATLRGEAAEVYLRWERELKPRGFHLTAEVLDFPAGVPGDIGLFLVWDV